MPRTDGDSWDIATSVGATAVMVALARAKETASAAAGLDSRAYRLSWPAGTVVFEIDLPKVLEYKVATLAAHGAEQATTRRDVAVDLRDDWPKALRDNGFDESAPTTWLAEGLLPFLPAQAQGSMFTAIDRLSVAGSRISLEAFDFADLSREEVEERWEQRRAERAEHGLDTSFSPLDLWYDDVDRPDCAEWFAAQGWTTTSTESDAESRRLGREPQPGEDGSPFTTSFVTATK